ncbi:MAG: single-strand DNA-binding protein [Verrucomicrobiales bacterium]|jgi:single-strand DNA-binding protein
MAKGFEIDGKIHQIDDIQTFNSGFSKREFVVEVEDGKFPQMLKFECVKDKTALTDGHGVGDVVKVSFDIRGNEYNGRYYVNLNAWRVEKSGGGGGGQPQGGGGGGGGQGGGAHGTPPVQDGPPSHLSEPRGDYDDSGEESPF